MKENDIPDTVLEYCFDFDWDESKVWSLDYPIEEVAIETLEWHFDIPFWNYHMWYDLKPKDVIENPSQYEVEYKRIIKVDTTYPIDVMENKGRLVILDGLHRLAKQKIKGKSKVAIRNIPRYEIFRIQK